jgi:hypothetical protein
MPDDYVKKERDRLWAQVMELSFVLGYFKGELRGRGYTSEQLTKLEQDAKSDYDKNWK